MQRLFSAIFLLFSMSNVSALDIKQWQSSNGAKVLFVATDGLAMIDIRMGFKAGSSRDGDLPGISRLTNALIVDGTGDLTAEEIAETMESVGAQLGHDSLQDMAWSSLRLLSNTPKRKEILDLYARVTGLPTFPKDAIERDRVSMLTSLKSRKHNISKVTSDAFNAALYKDHVYEIGAHGTQSALSNMTQNDLMEFHKKYYVANNATVSIVGDLSIQQAKQLSENLTQYLKAGQAAQAIKPPKATQASVKFIDFDSTQTHIVQGLPVLTRKDEDYFSLYVGNHILGGSGFGSRLMDVIRKEKGLSYSVYSYFLPMESNGPFQMAMQTANHQVAKARSLLDQLLEEFIENGPSDDELLKAKKNITGGFALKIDSNSKIINYLALIAFYDLPLDYLDTFNAKIEKVTLDDIKDAFSRRVKIDQMIEIIVGPNTLTDG